MRGENEKKQKGEGLFESKRDNGKETWGISNKQLLQVAMCHCPRVLSSGADVAIFAACLLAAAGERTRQPRRGGFPSQLLPVGDTVTARQGRRFG